MTWLPALTNFEVMQDKEDRKVRLQLNGKHEEQKFKT